LEYGSNILTVQKSLEKYQKSSAVDDVLATVVPAKCASCLLLSA